MFKPIVLLVALAISRATATPTLSSPRSCQTAFPWTIDTLRAATPDTPSTGHDFHLARSGNPLNNTAISAITFFIPANSYGCSLNIAIPTLPAGKIAGGGSSASFFSTKPWGTYKEIPSWNHPPAIESNVGTFTFPTVAVTAPYTATVATSGCANTMSYLVELSDWQGAAGHVDFTYANGLGFTMTYNC